MEYYNFVLKYLWNGKEQRNSAKSLRFGDQYFILPGLTKTDEILRYLIDMPVQALKYGFNTTSLIKGKVKHLKC